MLQQADALLATEKSHQESDVMECMCVLQQLCPVCFGGADFGWSLEEYVLP